MKKSKMTRKDAARIQSATCKTNNGITPKGSFAARSMSAAYRNEPLAQDSKNSSISVKEICKIGFFAVATATVAVTSYYVYHSLNLSK